MKPKLLPKSMRVDQARWYSLCVLVDSPTWMTCSSPATNCWVGIREGFLSDPDRLKAPEYGTLEILIEREHRQGCFVRLEYGRRET